MRVIVTVLFVLLLLLQGQLWFGSHGVFQLWSLQRTTDDLRVRNNKLTHRNEQLHAEVQELRQGKEALEERARSHLGFIKEGETFYRVIPIRPEQKKQERSD